MIGKTRSSVALGGEETSSTRRRIQDVLGQARAALRQSQQFRPRDLKNTNLSSRLAFQQQPQEDYWSTAAAVSAGADSKASTEKAPSEKVKPHPDDGFGQPFRDEVRKKPALSVAGSKYSTLQHSTHTDGHISDSSTTVSVNTADLKVTSPSESTDSSDSEESQASQRRSRPMSSIQPKSEPNSTERSKASTRRTPYTAGSQFPESVDESRKTTALSVPEYVGPRRPAPSATTGKVEKDDLGFSRAHVMNSEADPHWFEKALLVRGESISEAAYKAFKKTHENQQTKQDAMDRDSIKSGRSAGGGGHKVPMFTNADPEFTADWMSEAGLTSTKSEVVVPNPTISCEIVDDVVEDELEDEEDLTIEAAAPSVISEIVDTSMSVVRTASELESSGIIEEIKKNLKVVLSISNEPSSAEQFSRMTPDEESYAKEYDQAMESKSEPLGLIFSDGFIHYDEEKAAARAMLGDDYDYEAEEDWEEEEEYENTFIESATMNTVSKEKSLSKGVISSSKAGVHASSTSTVHNTKKSSTINNTSSKSKGKLKKESTSLNSDSTLSKLKSPMQLLSQSSNSKSKKSTTRTTSESKSKVVSTTSSGRRHVPVHVEHGLDPPSSRHQKNIQTILEKEVYQKELKKIRSEKLKESRAQERLEQVAKESLERNKWSTWVEPDYTEILLPELFKYKSVSGLQAAKAKRSAGGSGAMNFGSPYFQINGALSDDYGTSGILAAARVESLDIPDLVREVLASNERMYKMTVEASEQMAKAYEHKVSTMKPTSGATRVSNGRRPNR